MVVGIARRESLGDCARKCRTNRCDVVETIGSDLVKNRYGSTVLGSGLESA